MLIKLVEIRKNLNSATSLNSEVKQNYFLSEVYINPNHIVCMREDESLKNKLERTDLPVGLDKRQTFTRLNLERGQSGVDITVIGSLEIIKSKIDQAAQQKVRNYDWMFTTRDGTIYLGA